MTGFRTVIFDCDSTLSRMEGIEELAGEHAAEIARLTDRAMAGEVPLEEVYRLRLDLIKPSYDDLLVVGHRYVERRVPGLENSLESLRRAGIDLRVISGGLLPAVLVFTRYLGIPDDRVRAVDVEFGSGGEYLGFDTDSPLARSGGKLEVIREWAGAGDMAEPVLLVGDGATDLEARPAVQAFAAYTGVVQRDAIVAAADFVIPGPRLDQVVELAISGAPTRNPSSLT